MGKSIVKKIAQNQNTSLPNIKILNQLKSPPIKTVQPKKGNAIFEDNKNININTKNIKKENSNLSVSKNNQKKAGNLICKEKISISKSPELISLKRNKYEEEYLHKNNLDIIQLERRKLYGNNINNKRQKINNYYNAYLPIYRNNKYYNYGINNKLSNESYKYGGIFPSIFNNKSLGGVNYSSNNKVIANRRLNPIITKKSLVKINI